MVYYTVLDDVLLKELCAFKHAEHFSQRTIEALLHFYKPPHITNIAQLQRIGVQDSALMTSLAQQSWANAPLEELSKNTVYKIILGVGSDVFPHINVLDDCFENNYTSTFYKGDNRDKIKEHIKALLNDTKCVFIYDKYFKPNWSRTKTFFRDLVPHKPITFFYKEDHFDQKMITEAKKIFNWKFRVDTSQRKLSKSHDRYLILDNKIEIILTSGFDNLFDVTTDFSYIIRYKGG